MVIKIDQALIRDLIAITHDHIGRDLEFRPVSSRLTMVQRYRAPACRCQNAT